MNEVTERPIEDQVLVDTRTAAQVLCMSEHTLNKYRQRGTGPRFYRLGNRAIRYAMADLNEWAIPVEP